MGQQAATWLGSLDGVPPMWLHAPAVEVQEQEPLALVMHATAALATLGMAASARRKLPVKRARRVRIGSLRVVEVCPDL
jgi:hypothetical protein